ncbi:two component transcriptional regulator [Hydrogenophaga taeniospiralis CCUG 15921]|jgi:DNA-binding response OmpR family regulator|uniref:Two component transcriptional regulator n=1 Tax=Hydrogenophaga taeniospiralis CCUG 15921 TaxID=1281780 RepID=A0A9X4SBL4_9BURK|nr:response regulator transcription factor [Hydrogenophaga taeniospiralis]MDG5975588.1 two component transcriptional regulator [Hydrogenophaga taeniospiralis CCUG 15921]
MAHLLIVEDDELLRDALSAQLMQAGHRITTAQDGNAALQVLQSTAFEGVVLDLGLPHVDGLTVLRRLRERLPALPVLILTARDGIEDRVEGLNAGADDYLTKPFNRDELLARLQSMLRRASLPAFGPPSPAPVSESGVGNLRIDPLLPRAWLGSEAIDLTQREWVLLDLLVRHSGRVVSREDVLAAWQSEPNEAGGVASNALEVYVHRLRRKLANAPLIIRNIRGLGYMLEAAYA